MINMIRNSPLVCMVAAATIFFLPVKGFAQAQPAPDLDTGIAYVWTGGYWSEGELSGRLRFIITQTGFETLSNKLYIQWISDGPALGIEAQTGIALVNDSGFYVFGIPECLEITCQTLSLLTSHTYSREQRELKISIDGLGVVTSTWQ